MARARRLGGELRTLREGPLPTRSSRCSQEPPWNMEGMLCCADRLAALEKGGSVNGLRVPIRCRFAHIRLSDQRKPTQRKISPPRLPKLRQHQREECSEAVL